MSGTRESVNRLTEPWTLVLTPREAGTYRAQDFPPLLTILAGLVSPSKNSRGGGGDVATRNVVDTKALTLLMHIQDVTGAWAAEYRISGARFLLSRVLVLATHIETLWRTQQVTESDYLRRVAYFDRWAQQIWDLVEPPLQIALKETTCPKCDRAKWVNDDEEWVDNILVSYRLGGEVQAECRWRNCDGYWVGAYELRNLGFHAGATVDDDTLREMGYAV